MVNHESWLTGQEERRLSISDPDDVKADIVETVRDFIHDPMTMHRHLVDLVEALNKAEEEW